MAVIELAPSGSAVVVNVATPALTVPVPRAVVPVIEELDRAGGRPRSRTDRRDRRRQRHRLAQARWVGRDRDRGGCSRLGDGDRDRRRRALGRTWCHPEYCAVIESVPMGRLVVVRAATPLTRFAEPIGVLLPLR